MIPTKIEIAQCFTYKDNFAMKNIHTTVDRLREQGYKIRVTHFRYAEDRRSGLAVLKSRREIDEANSGQRLVPKPFTILPNGGKVEVEIESPDGKKVSASSHCSQLDNFKRKVGTTMAFGRAVKQLTLSKAA